MVPCLVTLTDPFTRRAGVSASAELLVYFAMFFQPWDRIIIMPWNEARPPSSCVNGHYYYYYYYYYKMYW